MANRRFIDFPIASSVGDNDIVLIWQDGMNKQTTKGTLIQGAPTSLEGLTDVNIAGLINGQILQYNSTTGKWENVDRTDINLSELGDVSIVSPSNGQVLVYNSSTSKWENSSGGYVPYTGAVTTVNLGSQTIQAGSFVKAGGTSSQFLKADGSIDSTAYGTGSVTSVGLTMPSAFNVANTPVTTAGTLAVTGAGTVAQYIRGDGSLETFPALTGFVPYTGATADVNLGTHDLAAERGTFENNGSSNTLTVNHTSGSGYGIIVTKGGNNEALYVSKTSGSGNAMTVVGGRTSLVDLALSSVTNTAGDFLTLSGGVVHKRTAAQTLTDIGGQAALTNPVTGTGTTNYLPKFTGTSTIGNSALFENNGNVGLGTATPLSVSNYRIFTANGTNGSGYATQVNGTLSLYFYSNSNGSTISEQRNLPLFFETNGTLRSTLDASGNLGLGVTPSAASLPTFENQYGFLSGQSEVNLTTNAYFNSGFKFIGGSNFALRYHQSGFNGSHQWLVATGGTAGNAITFTQAMTLTSGGNLLVGPTTDAGFKLDVNGTGRFRNSSVGGAYYGQLIVEQNGEAALQIKGTSYSSIYFSDAANPYEAGIVYDHSTNNLELRGSGNSPDLTITSGNNVGIGTASPSARLQVNGNFRLHTTNDDGNELRGIFSVGGGADPLTFTMYKGDATTIGNFLSADGTSYFNGGNVLIGTTTSGSSKLRLVGLPTSAAGLSSGDVYNLAGVLMIA